MRSYNNIILASCLFAASSAFTFSSSPLRSHVAGVQHKHAVRLYAAEDANEENKEGSTTDDLELPTEGASDILNSPAFLKRKIDVLKSDISKVDEQMTEQNTILKAGKEEWGTQIDGLQEEFQNFSTRLSKANEKGDEQATMDVARKMLDVLDNFDRAFGVVTAESDEEKEIEIAYKNTNKMVLDIFESLGVKEVETLGKEFDYEYHQAVMMRPHEDYEEGLVCEELAKGYEMESGKLIRAAMVSVAS
mmetsp:Transcript_14388/g.13905  ORF Transcript_14388/g.13905 Transcript_14388/m.13905 type:complete len:248 (-) Transcript_14388:157-900(-)|eukprot:CAMPEP_0197834576 /NCGR_PEP_ID=MMETSP1437-20131217/22902_1 /TAXON_ID=49252 ORGANISM="Eucampia antarctica, Strain CCMP1452" /NCGR_SAMPLE_ID=MMETSP1437 /ASSEMBLY_ACC=CAM_ASM_001096 /LENGTH=247 /DNA_ID=CAMNT_0043439375 /DNA_START=60 /DNA_END=803 /DNA_ORIENTATION=+